MASDVTINTAINQATKTEVASNKLAEDFTQFLTLLTVQLQNQDPLSPMDTTEFTNQLVAFTGVEQQINTNQKLDNLVALQLSNVMGSALGYVGMDVSYVSSEFTYNGTPAQINYALDSTAVDAKIRIYDETGTLVRQEEALTGPGKHEYVWDGLDGLGNPVEPGTYQVKIDALGPDDESVGSTTVVKGNVRGVETQDGLIYLLVGERAVAVSNVLNVSVPLQANDTGTDDAGGQDV